MNTPTSSCYKPWLLAFVAAAALLDSRNVSAQTTRNWSGGTGPWETSTNWSGSTVPSGSDQAGVRNGGTATISSAVSSVDRIYIGGATLSQLKINSTGSLHVTGNNLIRIAQNANDKGAITIDGGTLQGANSSLYIGVSNNTVATLTVQNGGTVSAVTNILMATSLINGVTSTLNIGGDAEVAADVGWLNATKVIGGTSNGLTAHTNVLNFNHTSDRYLFTKSALSSDAVLIENFVKVHAKAGVTVLTGSNNYTQGTTVSDNAVLLANYNVSSSTHSSTGAGSVEVQTGGTLGGIGYILGNTTVAGTLKPGDYDYDAASPSFAVLKFGGNLTLGEESSTIIGINGTVRGTSFSAINVDGSISLDGEFKIQLWDDFTIADGETKTFQIFSGQQSITGGYEVYTLPDTWNGLNLVWNTSALAAGGYISVDAIPEPLSGALLLGGAVLLFGLRSRVKRTA